MDFKFLKRRAANYLDPHLKGIYLKMFKYLDANKDEIERGQVEEEDDQIVADKENNMDNMESNINNDSAIEDMSPTAKLRLELEAADPSNAKTSQDQS